MNPKLVLVLFSLLALFVSGCATSGSLSPAAATAPRTSASTPPTYRGFTIDDSRVRGLATLDAVRAATQEQIDMVCAVGVPPEILAFWQTVPFKLVPEGSARRPTPGLYTGRMDRSVEVVSSITTVAHLPVLLHELLHAYHDQQIPTGFGNRDILRFFAHAEKLKVYALHSHMMENEKEFFACAATAYLYGVTAQEPFHREKLQANQPEFYAYLTKLFGPTAGTYAGSIGR